jgi:hypothetical protein
VQFLHCGWIGEVAVRVEESKMKSILLIVECALFDGCRTNETPAAQVDDMRIAADVKAKLASDIGLSTVTNVSVNSTNGVVTLSGQVDSNDVKSRVTAVAKNVPKVVRVVDALQVAPKGSGRRSLPVNRRTIAAV